MDSASTSPSEKHIVHSTTTTYATLNDRAGLTQNVWVVFHGIGYLSRYFLRYFKDWDLRKNYIIAPQAPSLYYLSDAYKHIGACWLTRENTGMHMENLLNYLDALHERESLKEADNLCLLGYSQGVSVLCRWVAERKLKCSRLIIFAGRVPDELLPQHFSHLDPETRVEVIIGSRDPFLERESRALMHARLRSLFGERLMITEFDGGHEFRPSMITQS